jgi:hypothetical protein
VAKTQQAKTINMVKIFRPQNAATVREYAAFAPGLPKSWRQL